MNFNEIAKEMYDKEFKFYHKAKLWYHGDTLVDANYVNRYIRTHYIQVCTAAAVNEVRYAFDDLFGI